MNQTNPPHPPATTRRQQPQDTVSRLASTTWHAVEFSKNGRAPHRPSRTPQEATVQTYPTTPTPSTTRPKHSQPTHATTTPTTTTRRRCRYRFREPPRDQPPDPCRDPVSVPPSRAARRNNTQTVTERQHRRP